MLVDPTYAVDELLDTIEADGMRCVGVLATHYHPDHVGGSMMGFQIEGVAKLLERCDCPIHVQRAEAPWVMRTTGVGEDSARPARPRRRASPSAQIDIHARPHARPHARAASASTSTAGSSAATRCSSTGAGAPTCPGSDVEQMYESLQTLAAFDDSTIVYPGHRYSVPSSGTIAAIKESNYVFRPRSKEQWLMMFGR